MESYNTIKQNVVSQYHLAIDQLKKSSFSMNISANKLAVSYKATLDALDNEMQDFRRRDGNYILLLDDNILRRKLEQSLNKIANSFLRQIYPISSGLLKTQLIEEEEVARRDAQLRDIINAVNSGAVIAEFSGDVVGDVGNASK